MSISLTSNFFLNARGVAFADSGGVTWSFNKNTNTISAVVAGAAGGTVTSVGLSDGSTAPFYTITGSPVTVSGTLTVTLKTQSKNLLCAGPASGSAAQPTFRALVAADLPGNFSGNFLGNAPASRVGYTVGSGGLVVQGTSRSTGVTLNTICGGIELFSAAGSAALTIFTVTNSTVAATDVINMNQATGSNAYVMFIVGVFNGSFQVGFYSISGSSADQPVFNFSVIKAAQS